VGAGKFLNNGDPNSEWGTNAYLQAGFGMDIKLEAATGENVYNLNTNVSNGGNSNYLANSTWCDGDATPWTFRAVDGEPNVYQIINNGQYIMANEAGDDVEMVGDPAGRTISNTYWKLVSENDFKAAMQAKAYSATDPMDVSVFIKGRSFARNDGRNSLWTTTHNGGNWTWIGASENKYYGNEAWNNTFDVHQEITGLPDGTYEVQCSGFGTNGTTYIYGNTTSKAIQTDNTTSYGASKEAKWKAIHEDNAFAGQSTGKFTLSGGNLTVGLKRETNTGGDWCVYDEFRLYYYGLDLSEFAATLAEAVAAAEAVEGTVPTAAYNELAAVVEEQNQTYTTAADYTAAASAIETATNTAKALQPNYARYINVRNAVLAINNSINVSEANSQAEAATTAESLETAVQTVRTALANYLPTASLGEGETIDLTDALLDNAAPGVSGNTDYWTNSNNPGLQYNLFEFYNISGATTKQIIATSLPKGNYILSATAFTRTGYVAKLSAGDNNTNIVTVASGTVNNRQQGDAWIAQGNGVTNLVFNLAEATPNLEIGLTADNANGDHWMCWRSFRLVYGDVFEPYTLVEGKMNADVAAAQTAADNAFQSNPSPATYMAVQEAIAAAQASKDAYVPFTTAIDKIDAALAAATTATASTDDYDAVKATYTAASVADADVRTAIANAYNAVIPVIKSQTAANADFTLAIQNHSFEYGNMTGWTTTGSSDDTGVREASNPTYAATGSDGFYLFNTWWQGVPLTQALEELPTGEYTLTASVASDGATIYLLANGEHNEGTETGSEEVTTYPTKDTFQDATFTFLVKDGNLTIGVVGGAGGDAGVHKDYVEDGYWWYKADNFRLVKNRDLTEDELAVIPTAIALYNGEVEVTEPIALDATNASVTLTPNFTPADATQTVTWTSSDDNVATVANGVVTAVAPGTATITVTSTLAEVSASATVNVTFPETDTPGSYFVNDNAIRTVYTVGENLIKNGAFEYGNNFFGWTVASGASMSADNFDLITEENNHYIKAKGHTGASGVNSIGTGWAIEAGKTYVFGYRVKSTSAGNSEFHKVSLTNTLGTETLQVSDNATAVGTDWTDVKYTFTNTDNYAYVQFRARWLNSANSFDDFYLAEVTSTTEGNVEYATAAIPNANIGTGAFQYSQDAINAANGLVQGEATVEDVTNAYNALQVLNAPADGQLFNIVNITSGFAHNGKALTFKSASNADLAANTTSMAWEAQPGYYMPQAVKFTAVEGTVNGYKLSYTRADGNVVYISTGTLSGLGDNHNQIRPTTDAGKALTFVVTSVADNKWYLYNTEAGNNVGSNGDAGFYTAGGSNKDMKIQEAVNNEVALNIKAENKYGTIILPFDAEVPSGVTAYSVSEADGATLTLVEANEFSANTPYIVFAEEGATASLVGLGSAYTDASYTAGLLTGVYTSTLAPVGSYVLQKKDGEVGFYVVADGKQPTVGANRAYVIRPSEGGDVKAFYLGGGADAIQSLFDGLVNGDAYDLGGRKVSKLQKGGVYIVNGKKVIVK
jgi:hypothetical protein